MTDDVERATIAGPGFSPEDLRILSESKEIEIETWSPSGEPRRTVVWIVVVDGVPYIRALRGERGRWYRDLRAEPHGAVRARGRSIPVRAVPADDDASIAACSDGFRRKYRPGASLDSMLRPEVLTTTMRLEPA